ncbi:MAG TPA: ABC transporter substrate-binding protein [Anaerolineae bacterium]|nr:ABC transporter substrate-binding protein [Anaerolineae bacterium]
MLRRFWLAITAVVLLALVVGGCAQPATPPSGTEGPEPTAPPEATQPPAATEPAGEPQVITSIMWQQFIDLDPAYAVNSEQIALNLVYENLVYMNTPGSAELLGPGLATSWEPNDDATEWTFHLREGVTFQDGEPFNADAVEATLDHYRAAEGAGCSWIWGAVEEVEVVDEYTVKVKCSYPAALDVIATSTFCGGMISPAVTDQPKEWFDAANGFGTGPYMYESYDKGQRLILTRFDNYWKGWQDNQFDKVVFEIVEDIVQRLQMIEAGEADILREMPPDKVTQLQANPNLKTYIDPSYMHMQFLLNTQKAPLNDPLVREALAYSVPYDEVVERGEGIFTQSRGAVPAAMWGHCDDCFQYTYDPEKAGELLDQAGWVDTDGDGIRDKDGQPLHLLLTYTSGATAHAWPTELWVFPAAEVGIELETQGMTYSAMWEYGRQDPQTAQDITIQQWWPTYVTPYDALFNMYHCQDEILYNQSYYCNPEYDAMIDEADRLTGTDREAAVEMFQEAQKILVEENPAIWVMDILESFAISADIEGFVNNPAYPGVVFIYDLTTTR